MSALEEVHQLSTASSYTIHAVTARAYNNDNLLKRLALPKDPASGFEILELSTDGFGSPRC
jgi:hypothetical protein